MINELQTKLYTALRKTTGLSQGDLAAAAGISRRALQKIENGLKLPSEQEEEDICEAAHANRIFVAELACKAMSEIIGLRVAICAEDEIAYQATTTAGKMCELLLAAHPILSQEEWWAWREREGYRQALAKVCEQMAYANVRDLATDLKKKETEKERATGPEEELQVPSTP